VDDNDGSVDVTENLSRPKSERCALKSTSNYTLFSFHVAVHDGRVVLLCRNNSPGRLRAASAS
jgi:hypothetical protein